MKSIVDRSALLHIPKSSYAYAYSKNSINVRLRTKRGEFSEVNILFGDKYSNAEYEKEKMQILFSDYMYDYYEINLKSETKRLIYAFEMYKNKERLFFTEAGIKQELDMKNEAQANYFQYPYINNIDIHRKPSWTEDSVFYQIFPDRFFNGNPDISPENVQKWGTKPRFNSFMGGDLKGILEKIPYLKELGVNTLYLTPIFKSGSNHKYDTADYYEIDPCFGEKKDFKKLVDELHKNGMKIVLDAVFNHSGIDFFAFEDVCRNGEKSKYKDWFYIKKFPVDKDEIIRRYKSAKDGESWYLDKDGNDVRTYEMFAFYPYMPKFNTENRELKKYLIEAGKYWIREYKIDGWRLDVANEIDHQFWREFRSEIKALNPESLIIGEVWHNAEVWLRGDQFDSVMNYPLNHLLKHYIVSNTMDKEEFCHEINKIVIANTGQVNEMMLNFLSSHDIERYYTACSGKKGKLLSSYAFIFTFIGIPMIYYGDEIGMKGGADPDCRRCMDWDENNRDKKIFETVKRLIKIRKENKALKKGSFSWIELDSDLLSYIREYEEEKVLVILNNTPKPKKIEVPKEILLEYDMFNEKRWLKNGECHIGQYGFKILKIRSGNQRKEVKVWQR